MQTVSALLLYYRASQPVSSVKRPLHIVIAVLLSSCILLPLQVGTHKLAAKTPAGIKNSTGWVTGLGAVRQNDLARHISYTTLCFSRPATVGNASIAGNLEPASVFCIIAETDE